MSERAAAGAAAAAGSGVTYSAREHFHPDRLAPGFVRVKAVKAQIDEPVPWKKSDNHG